MDAIGQEVVVALVLVAELGSRLRWRGLARSPSTALRAVPLPCKCRGGFGAPFPLPILVAAGDDIDLAGAVEAERDGHRPVEEIAVVADDEDGAVIVGDHFLEQVEG